MNTPQGQPDHYLSYLARQGLLERNVTGYVLSEKGLERLQYFDSMGCASFDCPLCYAKKTKYYTCPRCQYELPKEKARIKPEWNFLIGVRHAGVYSPFCQKLMFTEKRMKLILRADFMKVLKKAKIESFCFHDLRHTFATRLVQRGIDLYKVQKLLGHSMRTTIPKVFGMV